MTALALGQAAIERRMTDTCTITRSTGEPVLDETSGKYTDPQTTLYTGRCRVQSASVLGALGREAGDQYVIAQRATIAIPMGTVGIAQGDLVTITAAAYNPQLLNARYRVRSIEDKSEATAVRLQCEETP